MSPFFINFLIRKVLKEVILLFTLIENKSNTYFLLGFVFKGVSKAKTYEGIASFPLLYARAHLFFSYVKRGLVARGIEHAGIFPPFFCNAQPGGNLNIVVEHLHVARGFEGKK